jgi:hypothetical protein
LAGEKAIEESRLPDPAAAAAALAYACPGEIGAGRSASEMRERPLLVSDRELMFNYTPLVIRRTSKNKQLTIVKPTQTGIYRNKYTFCTIKSLEPLKNSNTSRVP